MSLTDRTLALIDSLPAYRGWTLVADDNDPAYYCHPTGRYSVIFAVLADEDGSAVSIDVEGADGNHYGCFCFDLPRERTVESIYDAVVPHLERLL